MRVWGGSVREYRQELLRRSFRDEEGKLSEEMLANLSAWPDEAIDVLRKVLAGTTLVDVGDSFTVERAVSHGHVGAAHVMASQLRFVELLGPSCPERDVIYALILTRVTAPRNLSRFLRPVGVKRRLWRPSVWCWGLFSAC